MISIVTATAPSRLELFAAEELGRYLRALYGLYSRISVENVGACHGGEVTFYLALSSRLCGNRILERAGHLPRLSAQGFVIKSTDENTVFLIGGSGVAVLWAVYELVERWGVVYSLQGDVFPSAPGRFAMPRTDGVWEPLQQVRSWRLVNDLMTGPIVWSLAQQKKVIGQLVKQKYNSISLSLWPQHPFLNFTVDGISRKSACFNFGVPIPITADNVGREHLPDAPFFTNPEFLHCSAFEEWYATGVKYVGAIIDWAKFFQMLVYLSIQPFDFAREYAPLLEKPVVVYQLGSQSVAEGGDVCGPRHVKLLKAEFAAYMETYPQADVFEISLPEHARSIEAYGAAWESLDKRFGLAAKYDMDQLLFKNPTGRLAAGGMQRSIREGQMTIVVLDALHTLLDKTGFVADLSARGKALSLSAGLSCPAMLPLVADALWDGARLVVCPAYTSSRAVRTLRLLDGIDTSKVPVEQMITFQDDNVGSVPQMATYAIDRLLTHAVEHDWAGYYTRFWPIGDLDPVSAYLSRASWRAETTPESAYAQHAGALYGSAAIGPFGQAMRLLEDATVILDMNHLGFMFPVQDCMTSRMGADKGQVMTEDLWHVLSLYEEVKAILSKTLPSIQSEAARAHMRYWIGRLDFGVQILFGMACIGDGNVALKDGDETLARAKYDEALVNFRQALEALAHNVRDDSDRGTLAVYYDMLVREVARVAHQEGR